MSLDSIVRGADWEATVTVNPGDGETVDSVEIALTGATVDVRLQFDGAFVSVGTGSVTSAPDRKILIGFDNATTAALAELGKYELDVRFTDTGAKIHPVRLEEGSIKVKDVA